jgi:hypothetical protein
VTRKRLAAAQRPTIESATAKIEAGARELASLGVGIDAIRATLDDAFWIANDVIEGRRPRTGKTVKGGTQLEFPRTGDPRVVGQNHELEGHGIG